MFSHFFCLISSRCVSSRENKFVQIAKLFVLLPFFVCAMLNLFQLSHLCFAIANDSDDRKGEQKNDGNFPFSSVRVFMPYVSVFRLLLLALLFLPQRHSEPFFVSRSESFIVVAVLKFETQFGALGHCCCDTFHVRV